MADDILELVEAAARPEFPAARRGRLRPIAAEPALLVADDVAVAEGAAELAMAVDLMARVPGVQGSFRHRSWELMSQCRWAKALQSSQRKHDQSKDKLAELRARASEAVRQSPIIARCMGLKAQRAAFDERRAMFMIRLAAAPLARGDMAVRLTQARAADVTAHALVKIQSGFVERTFCCAGSLVGHDGAASSRIHVLSWCWDETSQRIKAITDASKKLQGERVSHARSSVQVMMQSGKLVVFNGTDGEVVSDDAYYCRGLFLASQSHFHLLEGMRRSMPLDLLDIGALSKWSDACDVLILGFTFDRASANFRLLKTLWSSLATPGAPRTILPFGEPCAAHGVHLVKHRPSASAPIIGAVSTFATLMRTSSFCQGARDAIFKLVSDGLIVKKMARPAESFDRSKMLVELMYGEGDAANYLWKTDSSGTRVMTSFGQELHSLIAVVDLWPDEHGALVHWCDSSNIADSDGVRRGGAGCCADRAGAVEKVAVALLNLLVHRGWERSAENRWTYILGMLKRTCLGYLAGRVLPQCIRDMQLFWKVEPGMAAALQKLVDADQGNFSARQKLRLLRVAKVACDADCPWQLALEVASLNAVDPLLYDILGDGEKKRASLLDILNIESSPVCTIEQRCTILLSFWTAETREWSLFQALGGMFDNAEAWHGARSRLLQLSCSMFDHFTLRMSKPPYSLGKLVGPLLSRDEKLAVVDEFMAVPPHCRSMFVSRLLEMYPSRYLLLDAAPSIMQALDAATPIAIDFCERSHNHMRTELRSTGRSRSETCAANRVLVAQVKAEHLQRSGKDFSAPALPLCAGGSAGPAPAVPPRARGGNPQMSHRNSMMRAHKALYAPDRPLRQEELVAVRERAATEWASFGEEDMNIWRNSWKSTVGSCRMSEVQGTMVPAPPRASPDFRPLWGSIGEDSPIVPGLVVAAHEAVSYEERRKRSLPYFLAEHRSKISHVLNSYVIQPEIGKRR